MPSPTQDDIDWLRTHPDGAADFESHFNVPSDQFLRDPTTPKPTENDIEFLKKNPDGKADFEAHFGAGTADKHLKPTNLETYRSMEDADAAKNGPPSLMTRLSRAPQRATAAAQDVMGELFSPENWMNSAKAVGDVVSRVPAIVSSADNLKEVGRGALQGIAATPGAIGDMALAGVDTGAQLLTGEKPLSEVDPNAYQNNPLGSANVERMLEDWGNKGARAAGADGDIFDFSDPGTEEKRTARALGGFMGTGFLYGGPKALIPGATGAIGAEAAREVAPDSPGWQAAGGMIGAGMPSAVRSGYNAISGGAQAAAPVVRPFTEGGREQVVGNVLRDAAGNQPTDLQPNPLSALQPTFGQQTNNPGILALEKSVAKSTPTDIGEFKHRLMESHDVARDTVASLKGGGSPEVMRDVADRALEIADNAASDATTRLSTGRTPGQAGTAARERLTATEDNWSAVERRLWQNIDPTGENSMVDVDQVRQAMRAELSKEPKFFDRAIPKEIEEGLMRLNPQEPLSEIQPLRSSLLKDARAIRETDPNKARIYDNLARGVKNVIDSQQFDDPAAKARWDQARQFTKTKNELFNDPNEMQSALARNSRGGDVTNPSATLEKFIQPGAKGLGTVRQMLDVDNSPEMRGIIQDHLAAKMPDTLNGGRDFMDKYSDVLNEVPDVRDRLQQTINVRAAAKALRDSPISMFAGIEPKKAIQRIMSNPDRINLVRRLKAMPQIKNTPGAWDGMRAAYVDEILRTIDSTIERGADGSPTIKPGVMNKFYRDNADITHEILGPVAEHTLGNVADAVEMLTRTSRGGYPGGSDTFSMLSGDRFVDHAIEKWFMSPGAPAVAATAGFAKAGPIGAVAAGGGTLLGQQAFTAARGQIQSLLRDALLDPAKGRALMLKATPQSLRAAPRAMIPYLKSLTLGAAGPAAAGAVQTQQAKTAKKPLRPGQTVTGIIEGKPVTWRYKGGDPKASESWAQQ